MTNVKMFFVKSSPQHRVDYNVGLMSAAFMALQLVCFESLKECNLNKISTAYVTC